MLFTCCVYVRTPELHTECRWASTRPDDTRDGDVWDGTQLRNVPRSERRTTMYFGWCNDASVFKKFKEENRSPWMMECFNVPPQHRYTFACLFFVALLPPSVKSYNVLYAHVLDEMINKGAFSGFTAEDEKGNVTTLKIKLVRKVAINFSSAFVSVCT